MREVSDLLDVIGARSCRHRSQGQLAIFYLGRPNRVYTAEEIARPRENPFGPTNGDLKRGLEFGEAQYQEEKDPGGPVPRVFFAVRSRKRPSVVSSPSVTRPACRRCARRWHISRRASMPWQPRCRMPSWRTEIRWRAQATLRRLAARISGAAVTGTPRRWCRL
jgi:hypothetical protein